MSDSKTTIEKLNTLGIEDVTDYIAFEISNGETLPRLLELFKTSGWDFIKISCGVISIANTIQPSQEFLNRLYELGAKEINETVTLTVDKESVVQNVYEILHQDKWDETRMDRQVLNTVYGQVPWDTWYITTVRKLGE